MPAVLREVGTGALYELGEFSLIGRGEGATVRLAHQSISRHHATIRFEGGYFRLFDIGSANGTYVNEAALTGSWVLNQGDRLQLGDVALVFENIEAPERAGMETERTMIGHLAAPSPIRSTPMVLLVADIKGFTQISARLSPGEVADLLREWYADCSVAVRAGGGSIDKFIGDCFFAYWHGTDPALRQRALEVAEQLRAIEATPMTEARRALSANHGLSIDCRFGLHLGYVAVGAMGIGINTALGDAVNVAFRIEGKTRDLDHPILASGAFFEGWAQGREQFTSCGWQTLKGVREPVELFAPRRHGASASEPPRL